MRKRKIGTRGSASLPVIGPKRPLYRALSPLEFEDDFDDILEFPDYPAIALDFCHKTISGEWPACRYVIQACKKYLQMLKMAASGKAGFTFSEAHACDFLAFFEELPLVEDNFRGVNRAEAEPWQIFVGCMIYGFRDHRGFRYIKEFYLEVPRKHFKSGLAAAIALYDLRNMDSRAPLVLIAAAGIKQADRVYRPIKTLVETDEELAEQYKLTATRDQIACALNSGSCEKVTSIGEREDGWNPTTIILEELHAQDQGVYDVLKSAMGARGGQMIFQITTAGRNAFGLAWEIRVSAIKSLESADETRSLALIFTVDKEDLEAHEKNNEYLLTDEQVWMKANPMLGVSVDLADVRIKARDAILRPIDRVEFLRTRLNIWVGAASRVLSGESWGKCFVKDLKFEDCAQYPAYAATDLSNYDDLTCTVWIFELPGERLAVFPRFYLSDDSPVLSSPNLYAMMNDWVETGYITLTGHGTIDHRVVEADIRKDYAKCRDVRALGFDPAMAGILMKNLEDDGYPVVKIRQAPHIMTAPMDDLTSKIIAQQVQHDGHPVLSWCNGNVHGVRKRNDTIMPIKDAEGSENKIDGFVAMVLANALRTNPEFAVEKTKPSIYEKRGLLGAGDDRSNDGNGAVRT